MAMTPANVFTYGSLMYPSVWRRVVRGEYRSLRGEVRGYRRVRVAGASYPALIRAEPREVVAGVVYLDVSAADVARLDHFEAEGEAYSRVPVSVELRGGRPVEAWAYLALHPDRVEPAEWDPARFEAEDLARFLTTYCAERADPAG